jgi:hypothetical protein
MKGKKIPTVVAVVGNGGEDELCFLHRAGADAEDGICRADTDKSSQQRDHAYVTPHTDSAGGRQADQDETDYDAQYAVDCSFVDFHYDLLEWN